MAEQMDFKRPKVDGLKGLGWALRLKTCKYYVEGSFGRGAFEGELVGRRAHGFPA